MHTPTYVQYLFSFISPSTPTPYFAPILPLDGLKWMRVRDHIWFPDPSQPKGSDWLTHMILSQRFPEIGQLIDTVEQLVQERRSLFCLSADFDHARAREAIARLRTLGSRHRCTGRGDASPIASIDDLGDGSAEEGPTTEALESSA